MATATATATANQAGSKVKAIGAIRRQRRVEFDDGSSATYESEECQVMATLADGRRFLHNHVFEDGDAMDRWFMSLSRKGINWQDFQPVDNPNWTEVDPIYGSDSWDESDAWDDEERHRIMFGKEW